MVLKFSLLKNNCWMNYDPFRYLSMNGGSYIWLFEYRRLLKSTRLDLWPPDAGKTALTKKRSYNFSRAKSNELDQEVMFFYMTDPNAHQFTWASSVHLYWLAVSVFVNDNLLSVAPLWTQFSDFFYKFQNSSLLTLMPLATWWSFFSNHNETLVQD